MALMANDFSNWDFLIFGLTLFISMGIGVFFAVKGQKAKTQDEYLKGGKTMSVIPVAISLLVSFQSAVVMLGNPAEMYTQGTEFYLSAYGAGLGYALSGFLFVPLLYPLGLTSAYEYFELRFRSRVVRLMGTIIMAIGQITFVAVGAFAPSTALEAVTGFPVWINLMVTGVVATFYTTIGGIKAVVWTDVFQSVIMVAGLLSVIVQGVLEVGGLSRVFEITAEWDRLRFFNWDLDPRVRHTVWGLIIGQAFSWMGNAGITQAAVQRYSSLPTLRKAMTSVLVNVFGMILFTTFTCFCGVVLFAYYAGQDCDLLSSGLVDNSNQLIPYMVMDLLAYPCVPGLFMSALFCGALSTISSSLNALAAISWEDILKPHYGHLPDEKKTFIIKCLVAGFGVAATCSSFILLQVDGTVVQMAIQLVGPSSGTLTGIFLLGAVVPFANKYGALAGGASALVVAYWQSIGAYATGITNQYLDLPYPNGTCELSHPTTSSVLEASTRYTAPEMLEGSTTAAGLEQGSESDPLLYNFYIMSYMWITSLAIFTCLGSGIVVSLLTRSWIPEEERVVPAKYQLSIFNNLCCCLPASWRYYLNCGRTFEADENDEDILTEKPEHIVNKKLHTYALDEVTTDNHVNGDTLGHQKHQKGVENKAFEAENVGIEMTSYTRFDDATA